MAEKQAVGIHVMSQYNTRDQMAVTRANLPLFVRNSLHTQITKTICLHQKPATLLQQTVRNAI